VCSSCGVLLPLGRRGRCSRCTPPQRSGSSRPELDTHAWQKLRRAARLRDGDCCVRCGSSERLSVHHAVAGSSALEDLVTLCSRCHGREHRRIKPLQASHFLEASENPPGARGEPGTLQTCPLPARGASRDRAALLRARRGRCAAPAEFLPTRSPLARLVGCSRRVCRLGARGRLRRAATTDQATGVDDENASGPVGRASRRARRGDRGDVAAAGRPRPGSPPVRERRGRQAAHCDRPSLQGVRGACAQSTRPTTPKDQSLAPAGRTWAEIGRLVGQRKLSVTADTYTHVLIDGREADYEALLAA
jgi:HNH endonuclease